MIEIARVRATCAPSDEASSSPSATALSEPEIASASTVPTRMKGATPATMSHPRPESEPAPQSRISSKAVGLSSVMPDVMPPSSAPIATPTRVSRTGDAAARPRDPSE
jgi:hypothetical protein